MLIRSSGMWGRPGERRERQAGLPGKIGYICHERLAKAERGEDRFHRLRDRRAAHDSSLPEADREALASPRLRELIMTAAPEAFRQGVRGVVHEARICAQPWGFDLAAIKPPVCIWHGDEDTNVPVAMARHLAARIPDSSLTIYRGEGHLIVPKHWDEILAALLSGYPQSAKAEPGRTLPG